MLLYLNNVNFMKPYVEPFLNQLRGQLTELYCIQSEQTIL